MSAVSTVDYTKFLSEQQMIAGNQAIGHYRNAVTNWVILLAQMQSGKTETFLFIACELFRFGIIKSIIIFSGNAETDLYMQLCDTITSAKSSFWRKYKRYLDDEDTFEALQDNIIERKIIQVVWGTQKSSYCGPTENTLFIWEEAHFAQNRGQGPDKFLAKIGISADGDQNILQKKNNFVLTVSATPFSELSDNHHLFQTKKVVKMMPGQGYTGVKDIMEADRIKSWTDLRSGLNNALSVERTGKKWGIIRVTDNSNAVKEIILSNGWKYVEYDSSISLDERKKKTCREPGYLAWESMNAKEAPTEDTVILIKGMCRMGKNIKKEHLLFVFETSKNPASDTILQGLLGRVCGYGQNNVFVYLSAKVIKNGDIYRYVQLWENEGVKIIPRKANNLSEKKVPENEPIIPIAIKRDRSISNTNNESCIKKDVMDAFMNHPERITNKNTRSIFEEVKNKYLDLFGQKGAIRSFYLAKDKKTRGPDKALALRNAFDDNKAIWMGAGCGASDNEFNIWVNKDIPNLDADTFYITAVAKRHYERDEYNIPTTNKREIFAHYLNDGTELTCNGGMPKLLSPETAYNCGAMCDELTDFVEVSRDSAYYKGVVSLGTSIEGEPSSIYVTDQVLKQLCEGGRIYNLVKDMGAILKIEKARGPVPKSAKDNNLIRLASIKWDFIK